MARAPKLTPGKKIKSEFASVPQPDLTEKPQLFDVFFQVDKFHQFAILLPDHIAATLKHDTHVYNATYNGVLGDLNRAFADYRQLLTKVEKRRVLLVLFGASRREPVPGATDLRGADNSVQFLCHDLWEAGGKLYTQHEADADLRLVGPAIPQSTYDRGGRYLLDWTEERAAFFAAMTEGLRTLTYRLSDFFVALGEDPDRAIASAAGGGLLLEGPRDE